MSDVQPAAPSSPDANAEAQNDRTLRARKTLVWVLSLVIGTVITALTMIFLLRVELNVTFQMAAWQIPLIVAATLPMWFLVLIWLDYFMGTQILPD